MSAIELWPWPWLALGTLLLLSGGGWVGVRRWLERQRQAREALRQAVAEADRLYWEKDAPRRAVEAERQRQAEDARRKAAAEAERQRQAEEARRKAAAETERQRQAEEARRRQHQEERQRQGSHSSSGAGQRNSYRSPAAQSPYEVLGVPPDATPQEILAAYRDKLKQYHPDLVAERGPDIREVAERRTKEINAAYEKLKGRTTDRT